MLKTGGRRRLTPRRGWRLGSESFRRQMLSRMEGELGQHHALETSKAANTKLHKDMPGKSVNNAPRRPLGI